MPEDVACRVIAMLETPDHATIARFVDRHEAALAGLFGQVLGLCDQAGLVKPGVVAIDGTRLAGNTSRSSNRDFGQIAREILAEAKATDEAEDELYGDARGDELPEQLRTREGRREFFRQAREKLAAESGAAQPSGQEPEPAGEPLEFHTEQIVARTQGRQGWTREARRQLEQRRWDAPDRSRAAGGSGCCSRRSGWRTISTRNWRATEPMRNTARRAVTPKDGISAVDRICGWRRQCRTRWSA